LEWRFLQAETSTARVHVAGGGETQHGATVDEPFGYLWLGALLPSSALT
jgi:hypothetical protein